MLPFKGKSLISKATSSNKEPVAGFTLHEIAQLTLSSPPALCAKIHRYILRRLSNKDPIVKAKTLRVIKHIAQKGSKDFRMRLKQEIQSVKACLEFKCPPHKLMGARPQDQVRKLAKEAVQAIYSSGESVSSSRMQGFSSTNSSAIGRGKKSNAKDGGRHVSTGKKKYEGFGNTNNGGGIGGRAGWSSRKSSSLRSGKSAHKKMGRSDESNKTGSARVSKAATDGLYERNLVDALIGGGGVRSVPDKTRLKEFCQRCKTLKPALIGKFLRKKLDVDGNVNTVKRTIAVISALVQTNGCEKFLDYFERESTEIEDAIEEGGSLGKKAEKLFAVICPDGKSDDDSDDESLKKGSSDTADDLCDDLLGNFGEEGGEEAENGENENGRDDLFSSMKMNDGGMMDMGLASDGMMDMGMMDGGGDIDVGMDMGMGMLGGDNDGVDENVDLFSGMTSTTAGHVTPGGDGIFAGMNLGEATATIDESRETQSGGITEAFSNMNMMGDGEVENSRARRLSKDGVNLLTSGLDSTRNNNNSSKNKNNSDNDGMVNNNGGMDAPLDTWVSSNTPEPPQSASFGSNQMQQNQPSGMGFGFNGYNQQQMMMMMKPQHQQQMMFMMRQQQMMNNQPQNMMNPQQNMMNPQQMMMMQQQNQMMMMMQQQKQIGNNMNSGEGVMNNFSMMGPPLPPATTSIASSGGDKIGKAFAEPSTNIGIGRNQGNSNVGGQQQNQINNKKDDAFAFVGESVGF
eukprot:g5007.t1